MKSKQRVDVLYGGLGDLGEAAVVGVQWWVGRGGGGVVGGDVVLMLELTLTLTMMLMPMLMLTLMLTLMTPVKLTLAESERKGVEWRVCVEVVVLFEAV